MRESKSTYRTMHLLLAGACEVLEPNHQFQYNLILFRLDFMEEWIRMVSFPVSPIAARSCLRSAFVYAMSFLLFGRFAYPQFTAFCAARQARSSTVPPQYTKKHISCCIFR